VSEQDDVAESLGVIFLHRDYNPLSNSNRIWALEET